MIAQELLSSDFVLYLAAGFVAQVIDGALGMAYGVIATSLLLSFGVPPAAASATVHMAECFTTGVSALSHRAFGNVHKPLFLKLVVPGVLGAATGAYILASLPGKTLKPFVSSYLILMGCLILLKAFRQFPPRTVTSHLSALGFAGALVDAIGGGGWGPIVATTLIARGSEVRLTIGSVNAVEFFVTLAASVTFILKLGMTNWPIVFGLALGGVIGAPLGAWACKHLPVRTLMVFAGAVVIALSLVTLLGHYQVI